MFRKYNVRKAFRGKNAARKRRNTVRRVYNGVTTAGKALYLAEKVAGMVNAEKKRYDATITNQTVSQFNGATTPNFYSTDITPVPASGTGYAQRNGSSIKVTSSIFRFQFYQQGSTVAPMKIKYYIVQTLGLPQTVSTAVANLFQASPLVTPNIVDFNSMVDPDYFGQFRILRSGTIRVGGSNFGSQTIIKEFAIKMKYNGKKGHHIRFNDDTQTLSDGQIWFLMAADSGNSSGGTNTTATGSVPVKGVNTGMNFNANLNWYYYDN